MAIIRRMSICKPHVYSISGIGKDSAIKELQEHHINNLDRVITIDAESALDIKNINTRLVPDIIICDDFKPSRSFIKKTRRK